MRKRAFILILPFTVFLFETVSIVPAMQETCAILATAETGSCCKPATEESPEACSSEPLDEAPADDCTDNPDCSTCPVCYTFIVQPRFEWTARQFPIEKKYAPVKQDYIFSYSSSVWKPPNALLT